MQRIFTIDFTKDFIAELAGTIEREYIAQGKDLSRLAIVFGGKRPSHFLKRALAKRVGKSFVAPVFFTIDEFMRHTANKSGVLATATDLDDCFELYTLARDVAPQLLEGRESFARFLPWARDILDFIGQLDLEDVDEKSLAGIKENAAIGYPVPESINLLLQNISKLRGAFHARLIKKGRTCRGLQYLRAKENVTGEQMMSPLPRWEGKGEGAGQPVNFDEFDDIIFANFFYFHRTEEAVVKSLLADNKATLIFQGDERKWPVLERMARRLGCELKEGAEPTPVKFELQVHSAFDAHSEAAVVREILAKEQNLDQSVVVLPDPGSLVPLLSTLPDDVSDFNVSMGYPLQRGSLYVLLQEVFAAQLSRREDRYYARDYLKVLRHPFVKNLQIFDDAAVMRVLVHKLEEALSGRMAVDVSGSSFVKLSDILAEHAVFASARETLEAMGVKVRDEALVKGLHDAHAILFEGWQGIADFRTFAVSLGRFLDVMCQKSFLKAYPLNINIASRMYDIKDEFAAASFGAEAFTPEEIFRIFEDKVERELVSFSGTPLKGLQVLGLLETRSLNFKNVIIMDANEGVLPKLDIRAGLVPREVMMALKLDRLELEEEIQRYQFMRVISSADKVHVVYQKNKEKEPSRFVEELVWEEQKKKGRMEPFPTQHAGFGVKVVGQRREAKKTARTLEHLKHFTFSASSVNAYLNNSYDFYLTYVLGLREEEDMLDEPDAMMVGTFLHELLEEAYKPFLGRPLVIDQDFEHRLWAIFGRLFNDRFTRRMRSDAFLVRSVMEHKLKAFLDHERDRASEVTKIVGLERDFAATLPLTCGPVAFKARVDRVEELTGGGVLVIDYKSGSIDLMPPARLELPEELTRRSVFESVKSFQLPLYIYFLSQVYPEASVNAALYSLREAHLKKLFKDETPVSPARDFLEPYLKALDFVIGEILDPNVPFLDDPLKEFD